MPRNLVLALLILFGPVTLLAEDPAAKVDKPLWEYGVGVGYFTYENYPSSNNYSYQLLPFPIFQYRGESLRADDRDGARAYIFKKSNWSFDFSGDIWPGQTWATDSNRVGMPALPWIFALGPQLLYDFSEHWQFRLSAMPAFAANGTIVETTGGYFDLRQLYKWSQQLPWTNHCISSGNVALSFQGGTQDFLANYFEVSAQQAIPNRPAYRAVGGLLTYELSVFESLTFGRTGIYLGGSLDNYDQSANHSSPLDKSDHNFTYFAGLTYTLGESTKKAYKEQETEGLVNRYKEYKQESK